MIRRWLSKEKKIPSTFSDPSYVKLYRLPGIEEEREEKTREPVPDYKEIFSSLLRGEGEISFREARSYLRLALAYLEIGLYREAIESLAKAGGHPEVRPYALKIFLAWRKKIPSSAFMKTP